MVDLVAARKRVAQACAGVVMERHPAVSYEARDNAAYALRERFESPEGPLRPLCVAYDQVVAEVERERDAALKSLSELTTKRDLWMLAVREKRAAARALEQAQYNPISGLEAKARLEKAEAKLTVRENAMLDEKGVLRG